MLYVKKKGRPHNESITCASKLFKSLFYLFPINFGHWVPLGEESWPPSQPEDKREVAGSRPICNIDSLKSATKSLYSRV